MGKFNLAGDLAEDPELAKRFTGAQARRWRESTGLSRRRLAALMGTWATTIERWEGMERVPARAVWALAGTERAIRRQLYRERVAQHSREHRKRRRIRKERIAKGLPPEPGPRRVRFW